jgi:hypothetical protein
MGRDKVRGLLTRGLIMRDREKLSLVFSVEENPHRSFLLLLEFPTCTCTLE